MKTLNKKILRQIKSLRVQVVTIGLVVASGVAIYIAARTAYESLLSARDKFYISSSFSDGFATLKRAPESVLDEISNLEGISIAKSRIEFEVLLDIPNDPIPSGARFVSITEGINTPHIRSGRLPEGENEVLLSEAFALANHLKEGDRIQALPGGVKKEFLISGTALSPEFIYIFRGSNPLPDDKHYGVFWMERSGMENYFGMKGAFNSLVFKINHGVPGKALLRKIDSILDEYGGYNSFLREKLPSHSFLKDEFTQLKSTALTLPLIFLGVAAFLLHIVSSRIIAQEREQIATLKALGYANLEVAFHYLKLISIISSTGALLGSILGYYLGSLMTDLYGEYYRFPNLVSLPDIILGIKGFLIGVFAGILGSFLSIRKILSLQPAQAMRPPVPILFKKNFLEFIGGYLGIKSRIVFRNLTRKPLRAMIVILGISSSVMIMVLGLFFTDAFDHMMDLQFDTLQRESVTVYLARPVSRKVVYEMNHYPGVIFTEGYRMVPIKIFKGNLVKELALQGVPDSAKLRRIIRKDGKVIIPPKQGIYLNSTVADKLGIQIGESISVQVLEGRRNRKNIYVEGTIEEIMGQGAYMHIDSVNDLTGEGDSVNLLALRIDTTMEANLLQELKNIPLINSISTRKATLGLFKELMSQSILATAFVILIFASVISVGVIYNTAMIALSERTFELGSLRVLGFTKNEVFGILSGELSVEVLIALPIGCGWGYLFAYLMINSVQTEGFSLPLSVSFKTYFISLLTTIITAIISNAILYRKIQKMDLISILKIRE